MSTETLGSWRNPPLAYVVAEVAISPHYSLPQFVPLIQQGLRDRFPRTIEGTEVSIDISMDTPSPTNERIWRLLTADQGRGVHLGTRALSLHSTRYHDFPEFVNELQHVLDIIESSQLKPFVDRVGLRYIDYILPSGSQLPSAYITAGLQGAQPIGAGEVQGMMWVASYPFKDCQVNTRVGAPAPKGMLIPPNFAPLPLAKPSSMEMAEQRVQLGQAIGFIDTDCSKPVGAVFKASELIASFGAMHDYVSATFKALISPLARDEWI